MLSDVMAKEQRLVALQVFVFAFLVMLTTVIGTVVYSKTSIHDKDDEARRATSITDGFGNLQKTLSE